MGIGEVHDDIWLVGSKDYDLGYFDLNTRMLEPLQNPFGPKVLPMWPVRSLTCVSGPVRTVPPISGRCFAFAPGAPSEVPQVRDKLTFWKAKSVCCF